MVRIVEWWKIAFGSPQTALMFIGGWLNFGSRDNFKWDWDSKAAWALLLKAKIGFPRRKGCTCKDSDAQVRECKRYKCIRRMCVPDFKGWQLFIDGSGWGRVGVLHDSRKQPQDPPTTLYTLVSPRYPTARCGCVWFLLIRGWHLKFPSSCYVGGFFTPCGFRDRPRP